MSAIAHSLTIITGAGSGIGRALAIQAANMGAKVIATDVNEAGLKETVQLSGKIHEHHLLDVANAAAIDAFSASVLNRFPNERIILVNNAGVSLVSGHFSETPLDDFEWLLNINLWGVVRMTRAFLPHMVKQNQGHIVNMSSVYGLAGMPNNSAYSTAKFGVKGFSDVLKAELLGTNVKVSSVHPGGVKTNIAKNTRISGTVADKEQAQRLLKKFEKVALTLAPEKAAEIILSGIEKDKSRILVGKDAKFLDTVVRFFPDSYHKIFAKLFKL